MQSPQGSGPHTRLLIVDHLTPGTALILPLAEIAALCHDRGVLVLADGAHVPGNIAVDIDSFGVDWYVANLHKWAWAPRSAGLLWSAKQHQSYLHPTVISWGLDHGIAAEFDLLGTRDPTHFLTAPFAIELLNEFGGDEGVAAIYRYNHELAWWAGQYLADRWGTRFTTPEEMIGSMVNVRLPAAFGSTGTTPNACEPASRPKGIEVPIYAGPDEIDHTNLRADLLRPRRHRAPRRRRREAAGVAPGVAATSRQYFANRLHHDHSAPARVPGRDRPGRGVVRRPIQHHGLCANHDRRDRDDAHRGRSLVPRRRQPSPPRPPRRRRQRPR